MSEGQPPSVGIGSVVTRVPLVASMLRAGRRFRGLNFAVAHIYRYLTLRKICNIVLVNLQCSLRTETVFGRPYDIRVEPTNICNTSCQLCPTGIGVPGRPKGSMSWDLYKAIIDEGAPWLYRVNLFMWGDPLIAKDIYRMIAYAHQSGIWTHLSSNLHAFHPTQGHDVALVESGLDNLSCSLHGATQSTFEIYQPGKDLRATIQKIEALLRTRERMKSKSPRVIANFVVTRFNQHEVSRFVDEMQALGCEPVVSDPSLNLRFIAQDVSKPLADREREMHALLDKWLPDALEYIREPYRLLRDGQMSWQDFGGHKIVPCNWLWKSTVVNWDGTVGPCCGSWGTDQEFGDSNKEPLARIWNGASYRAGRRSFKGTAEDLVVCSRCPGTLL